MPFLMTNTLFFDFVNQKCSCTHLTNTDRVGGRVKAHISSQENFSQKEAELLLVGKENWMVTLVITGPRI